MRIGQEFGQRTPKCRMLDATHQSGGWRDGKSGDRGHRHRVSRSNSLRLPQDEGNHSSGVDRKI